MLEAEQCHVTKHTDGAYLNFSQFYPEINNKLSFFFYDSIFFFIANTYTKDSLKTVQIHGKITEEKKREYWELQFFDIERKGNGACGTERTEGPSADRTNQKL